jgi:hypothetical protein
MSTTESYIYLMKDKSMGFYKIGLAYEPIQRERTLQAERPTITLLASRKFDSRDLAQKAEKDLHVKYKDFRKRGEWFNFSPAHIDEILEYFIESQYEALKMPKELIDLRNQVGNLKYELSIENSRIERLEKGKEESENTIKEQLSIIYNQRILTSQLSDKVKLLATENTELTEKIDSFLIEKEYTEGVINDLENTASNFEKINKGISIAWQMETEERRYLQRKIHTDSAKNDELIDFHKIDNEIYKTGKFMSFVGVVSCLCIYPSIEHKVFQNFMGFIFFAILFLAYFSFMPNIKRFDIWFKAKYPNIFFKKSTIRS